MLGAKKSKNNPWVINELNELIERTEWRIPPTSQIELSSSIGEDQRFECKKAVRIQEIMEESIRESTMGWISYITTLQFI